MKAPAGFEQLCSGLHQDALLQFDDTPVCLEDDCLRLVTPANRPELRKYLARILDRHTAAELKGIINRQKTDFAFNSAGAKAFLEGVLNRLTP